MGFCAEPAGSGIPEGACACGAEGHMASIGPPALGAKGCVERLRRFAQGAADWRSGPRWSIISVLCPVHPFPLCGTSPQGETRDMREKTASHILQVPFRRFPPLVAGATTFPPLAGEVRRSRIGGGERSEPIRRMFIMLYDAESQSRNADFMFIARKGDTTTLGPKGRQT